MHLITQKALKDAAERFPRHAMEILALGKAVSKGYFRTPEALKGLFPSLDNLKYLDKHYVIDIGGNELRVIVMIFFDSQKFYVRHVFTHKEYDRFTAEYRRRGKK